jgi:voltage-gated potassium channel
MSERGTKYGFITKYWPALLVETLIMTMILSNVIVVICFSDISYRDDQVVYQAYYSFLLFSAIFFTVEYLIRVWSSCESKHDGGSTVWKKRISWILKPLSLIDLVCIVIYYLEFAVDKRR